MYVGVVPIVKSVAEFSLVAQCSQKDNVSPTCHAWVIRPRYRGAQEVGSGVVHFGATINYEYRIMGLRHVNRY